jgi:sodium-independent sulfate anion transporter 11
MDLLACLITCLASILLGMEYGILVGVGISLFALLLESLKPDLQEEMRTDPSGINYIYMQPESGIKFPSVDHIRSRVTKLGLSDIP